MNIAVKGVSVKENQALEDYAFNKASKLYSHFPQIVKIEVELRSEIAHKKADDDFVADIKVNIPGKTLKIADQEGDLYKSIDRAVDRMDEMLRREKGKKAGHLRRQVGRVIRAGIGYFPDMLRAVNKRVFRRR